MKSSTTLRWGILGCARITRRGLIPGIQLSESSALVAIASRDAATAQSWCDEFGVPRAYGSYEKLLADPEIDAVYIPLPNELHKQWVEAAADAGKHILCEKPLALDAEEARAMVLYCETRQVRLMEAFMWRHQPRSAGLKARVDDGSLGDIRLVRSSFSFPIDQGDWRLDPHRGGGALWDIGCYGVSTARFFAGSEPVSIRSRARFGSSGVDLSLTAELAFPNGVLGLIDCSFEQPFRCSYEVVGTRGMIEVENAYLPPAERSTARLTIDGAAQELEFAPTNQYACMVDAFAASIAAGRLIAPAEHGLDQMLVLEGILDAART